jgi:hypothetical protein
MGMTVEFYSADPQALVALFAADLVSEEENEATFIEQLKAYPVADFSFLVNWVKSARILR